MEQDETRITIESKLRHMEEQIEKLRRFLSATLSDYLASELVRSAVERQCQLIVECATDTNYLILASEERPPPQFAGEGYTEVRQLGVLDQSLEQQFRRTYVGLRNRLVHNYERLDDGIVYRTARRLTDDGTYIESVLGYLNRGAG